ADSTFTNPDAIRQMIAPIQAGTAKMTQANIVFRENKMSYDQTLQDFQNKAKKYLPFYVSEVGMTFTKADYIVSEKFADVENLEGVRLALDFIKRFGWGSIRKVDEVTIFHEKRR